MRSAVAVLAVQVSSAHPPMHGRHEVPQVVLLAVMLLAVAAAARTAWGRLAGWRHCQCADGTVVGTIGEEGKGSFLAVVEYVAGDRRYRLPATVRRRRRGALADHVTVLYLPADPSVARLGAPGVSPWWLAASVVVAVLSGLILFS